MTVQDIQQMFDYGDWANGKLFESMARLTPEQLSETLDGQKIRSTLVHMLNAERIWLSRCSKGEAPAALNPAEFLTPSAISEAEKRVQNHRREFLGTLKDEDLNRMIEFQIGTMKLVMPVGILLYQAANHGVHHRGQISLRLRSLGFNPENFDWLLYHIDRMSKT